MLSAEGPCSTRRRAFSVFKINPMVIMCDMVDSWETGVELMDHDSRGVVVTEMTFTRSVRPLRNKRGM